MRSPNRILVERVRPASDYMRVPDHVLKCVGFIAEVIEGEVDRTSLGPIGTGFLYTVPSVMFPNSRYGYFVTAKHLLKGYENTPLEFVVNTFGGSVAVLEGEKVWYGHPTDKTTDIAVFPIDHRTEWDVLYLSETLVVDTQRMSELQIGIGDDTFVTGLFSHAPGLKRNMPILRHGNLMMLPEEPIQVGDTFMECYLIEARSIGGISGSPVFVRKTVSISVRDTDKSRQESLHGNSGDYYFLGMMHGHWDVKESDKNDYGFVPVGQDDGVNYGIAIVVPASKIVETINQPALVELRAHSDRATLSQTAKISRDGNVISHK